MLRTGFKVEGLVGIEQKLKKVKKAARKTVTTPPCIASVIKLFHSSSTACVLFGGRLLTTHKECQRHTKAVQNGGATA